MIPKRNYYNNISPVPFIICKPNGDRIGSLLCTEKRLKERFKDYNEISFKTYYYNNNNPNELYNKINELMYIEVPETGRFIIDQINIHSEGSKYEYKECTAVSEEVCLGQKYLEQFVINMGTTESLDDISFCNLSDPDKSLLHLALEKCPDWNIGHVDNSLYTMQRCFEITRTDVYSFFMNNVSNAFECIFEFDTINHLINVYKEESIGENTNIYVSYNNLVKSVDISSSTDNIKTCLTITGANDLNVREVNMGYDRIYNIDYYHSLEYMSRGLYDSYSKWKELWNSKVSIYEQLVVQYQEYYNQIHYKQSVMMPLDPDSTDWTKYGLIPLKTKKKAYEQELSLMAAGGRGNPEHKDYNTVYLPCYNKIQAIKSQIAVIEKEISQLKSDQSKIGDQMSLIINEISMKNNFTSDQLNELSKYIREDELSSGNFVVTDVMTDSERMDMLHEMLEYGQKELAKISQPTLQFSMDMANIYAIPEFNGLSDKFQVSNYIHCYLRDDYIIKLRILEIDFNLYDESDFTVTFGNISKSKRSNIFEDITNALTTSQSVATTVSFNSSNWNKANIESSNIAKMLSDGLLAAGQVLQTSKSDVLIDDRGIIVSNNPQSSKYINDTIFIGSGQILFSDDGLKTIKTALGRVTYTKKGTTYSDFGLLAQFVIAGYIAGSVIEGNELIGGSIKSTNYSSGKYGSYLNLENGIFEFNGNGEKKLYFDGTTLTAKGTIQAEKGYIGGSSGFTIESGKIYSGSKSTFASAVDGIYLGIDGIKLGTGFSASIKGSITATSGTIGGATIENNSIKSSNGRWYINSDGSSSFTAPYIGGVKTGSSFGGVSYNSSSGTSGDFSNGLSANVNFSVSGGALSDFRNLVVDSIVAKKVLADYITANEIAASYATISSLNAAIARIGTIEARYVTTSQLNAVNAKFDSFYSTSGSTVILKAGILEVGSMKYQGNNVGIKHISLDGDSMNVLVV